MTLGGIICIRNGNEQDYCWREAIQSLLPVCDTVTVCDGESTDGTQEEIRAWMEREPKIKLCVYPWPNPKGDISFWVDWLQYARVHTRTDYILQLDADEVLHEHSHTMVQVLRTMFPATPGFTVRCHRYNFYKDTRHLIPHGVCLSHEVIRFGPQHIWLPSDGPDRRGAPWVSIAIWLPLEIFHYGYLRRHEAFFKKSRNLHGFFFDSYDQRLLEAEKHGRQWMEKIEGVEWRDNLLPFDGQHPKLMRGWLKERGWL